MFPHLVGRAWLARFKPVRSPLPLSERLHACLGGLLGLLLTAFGLRVGFGGSAHVPLLIAPLDPSPHNGRAIRAYEKAGFRAVRELTTPDGPALLMVVTRAEVEGT